MELLDRYLLAVRKHLPLARQADIVAELRANLEAQLEEQESELGRPLTEGEAIDWLKRLGSPTEMAAKYQPLRYLIGPTIFPTYWMILRLAVLWASVAWAVATVVRMITEGHGPEWLAQALWSYPGVLAATVAWVTGAFAAFEYVAVHYPNIIPGNLTHSSAWSPTSLPRLEKDDRPGKRRTFATAVAEFVAEFALIIWLLLIPRYPVVLMGPGAIYLEHSAIRLTHISVEFFWVIVVFNVVQLAWHGYNLLSGNWAVKGVLQKLAAKAMGVVPVLLLLTAPGHVFLEVNPDEAARMPADLDLAMLNHYLFTSVIVLSFIVTIQLVLEIWKVGMGGYRRGMAPGR